MNLNERIAWLRRMPMRWRILFGTQALIFGTAVKIRMQEIKRAQMIEERRLELEISANNGNGGGGDSGDD